MAIALALTGCAARRRSHDPAAAIELYQRAIERARVVRRSTPRTVGPGAARRACSRVPTTPIVCSPSFIETVNAWCINGDTILAAGIGQLVVLLARLGHLRGAVQLYGAATRSVLVDALVPELEATMADAREAMGDDAFRARPRRGRRPELPSRRRAGLRPHHARPCATRGRLLSRSTGQRALVTPHDYRPRGGASGWASDREHS